MFCVYGDLFNLSLSKSTKNGKEIRAPTVNTMNFLRSYLMQVKKTAAPYVPAKHCFQKLAAVAATIQLQLCTVPVDVAGDPQEENDPEAGQTENETGTDTTAPAIVIDEWK